MPNIALDYSITQLSTHGYKLTAKTRYTEGKDTQAAVFAIQVLPYVQQKDRQPQVRFSHICDLAQMQQYGTEYDRQYPYFRTDSIELIVHSRAQVQHILKQFQRHLKHLVRQLQASQSQLPSQKSTIIVTP